MALSSMQALNLWLLEEGETRAENSCFMPGHRLEYVIRIQYGYRLSCILISSLVLASIVDANFIELQKSSSMGFDPYTEILSSTVYMN